MEKECSYNMHKYIKETNTDTRHSVSFRLIAIYIIPVFLAFSKYINIINLIELILILSLINEDEFLYCLPIQIYFYQQMTIGSISVFRLYTLFYVFRYFYNTDLNFQEYKRFLPQVIICLTFSILVIVPRELQRGIFICLDVITLWSITAEIRTKRINKALLQYIVFAAVMSCVYGYFNRDYMVLVEKINGAYQKIVRYMGSFNDPNYASLFINIGIIICLTFPQCISNVKIRYVALTVLLVGLVATTSMTGIISLSIMLLVSCIFKRNVKGIIGILIFVGIMAFLVFYVGKNNSTGLFGQLYLRMQSKAGYLESSDIDRFSTERSALTAAHWDYFWAQDSVLSMLFGGNPISGAYTDRTLIYAAAHNEYVDLLLSIGLVGWIVYMGSYITMHIQDIIRLKEYKKTDRYDEKRCYILIRFCYLIYAFTLTMFLDHRFLFLLFL